MWLFLCVPNSLAEAEEDEGLLQSNVSYENFCTLKWITKEIPQQPLKDVKIIWLAGTAKYVYEFHV